MLKKLKCLEAANNLAREAAAAAQSHNSNSSSHGSNNNSGVLLGQTSTSVKIIKTEPLDFEMLHLEEKDLRERNLTRDNETITTITSAISGSASSSSTISASASPLTPPTPPQRYQHVQVQTVPPRQGITNNGNAQKVLLTPRVEYVQIPINNAGSERSNGTPQIIITRTLPSSTTVSTTANSAAQQHQSHHHHHHIPRRHSASPSQYQRISLNVTHHQNSHSAPSSPPPLHHQQQQQTTINSGSQHVRVIRDGRLYEESVVNSGGVPLRRHSVSPPPLQHYTRNASVSPANGAGLVRRYTPQSPPLPPPPPPPLPPPPPPSQATAGSISAAATSSSTSGLPPPGGSSATVSSSSGHHSSSTSSTTQLNQNNNNCNTAMRPPPPPPPPKIKHSSMSLSSHSVIGGSSGGVVIGSGVGSMSSVTASTSSAGCSPHSSSSSSSSSSMSSLNGNCEEPSSSIPDLAEAVTVKRLQFLAESDLDHLFENGEMAEFHFHLLKWKKEKGCSDIVPTSTNVSHNSTNLSIQYSDCSISSRYFDLRNILKDHPTGDYVIKTFSENKKLDDVARKILVDGITTWAIKTKNKLTKNNFERISAQIEREFCEIYFRKVGSRSSGRLFDKYHNTIKRLRKSGEWAWDNINSSTQKNESQ